MECGSVVSRPDPRVVAERARIATLLDDEQAFAELGFEYGVRLGVRQNRERRFGLISEQLQNR